MKYRAVLAIFALSAVATHAALADQSKVETILKANGFVKWKSIVRDKGTWEVDDAINAAGKQFDLRIDAVSQKITSKIAE